MSESESEDGDNDTVLDTTAAPSDSESSENEGEMESRSYNANSDDNDVEAIFTTTRSGRVTTNWRANRFVSIFLFQTHVLIVFCIIRFKSASNAKISFFSDLLTLALTFK